MSETGDMSRTRIYAGLTALAMIPVLAFIASGGWDASPVDDAWIFFRYAANLKEHGRVAFNLSGPGGPATSLAWSVLPGLVAMLGLSPGAACLALSALFCPVAVLGFFELALEATGNRKNAAIAGAVMAICGQFIWWGSLGMEIALYLALAMWAIVLFSRGRLIAAGILAGALALVRPDGLCLTVAIATGLFIGKGLPGNEIKRRAALCHFLAPALVFSTVCFVVNLACYGHLLPPGGQGRRWLAACQLGIGLRPEILDTPAKEIALGFAAFAGHWALGVWRNILGAETWRSVGLPAHVWRVIAGFWLFAAAVGAIQILAGIFPPLIPSKTGEQKESKGRGIAGVGVVASALMFLILLFGGGICENIASRLADGAGIGRNVQAAGDAAVARNTETLAEMIRLVLCGALAIVSALCLRSRNAVVENKDGSAGVRITLLAWPALHFITYGLFLPSIGQGARYTAPGLPLVILLLVIGIEEIGRSAANFLHNAPKAISSPRIVLLLTIALLLTQLCGAMLWSDVRANGIRLMREVYIPAAEFIRDNVPGTMIIGAFDIGVVSHVASRDVVDLGGITDEQSCRHLWERRGYALLEERKVGTIVLPVHDGRLFWGNMGGYAGVPDAPKLTVLESYKTPDPDGYLRWEIPLARSIAPEVAILKVE